MPRRPGLGRIATTGGSVQWLVQDHNVSDIQASAGALVWRQVPEGTGPTARGDKFFSMAIASGVIREEMQELVDRVTPDSPGRADPIGACVLRLTMAQTPLGRGDDRTEALRENMSELLRMDQPRSGTPR